MKINNKRIRKNFAYALLVSLLLHTIVIHGMFKSSVIGSKDYKTTSIESTFENINNVAHNNIFSAEHESMTDDGRDVLLTEQYDHNDKILINNPNNVIVKIRITTKVSFSNPANEIHPIFYTNLTPNSSTLLTQFKTVSLLI